MVRMSIFTGGITHREFPSVNNDSNFRSYFSSFTFSHTIIHFWIIN